MNLIDFNTPDVESKNLKIKMFEPCNEDVEIQDSEESGFEIKGSNTNYCSTGSKFFAFSIGSLLGKGADVEFFGLKDTKFKIESHQLLKQVYNIIKGKLAPSFKPVEDNIFSISPIQHDNQVIITHKTKIIKFNGNIIQEQLTSLPQYVYRQIQSTD